VAYSNSVFTGNKILANLNKVQMVGVQPPTPLVRLLEPAARGATSIKVDTGLEASWLVGDYVWLGPTSFNQYASDYITIKTYTTATGVITFDRPLKFYHFGAAASTASTYNAVVDIRGEVVLLSRNIRVVGDNTDRNQDWGGQMVTSDYMEVSGVERLG